MPTLAVLDLRDGGSIGPDTIDMSQLGTGLAVMLTTEMMKNPRVQMVEREQIRQLIEEQKLSLSGMAEASTAVQIGKLLGAQYMLFGGYTDVFGQLRIDVRIVEVETGRLRRAQEVTDRRENVFGSVNRLATALFQDLDLTSPTALAPPPAIPARAVLLLSRGIAFEDRGEPERARAVYREALQLFPDYAPARVRLARLEGR